MVDGPFSLQTKNFPAISKVLFYDSVHYKILSICFLGFFNKTAV
jgi:hypothetical protein